ncbi:beta strand repeat-containing protein, partial [Pseudoalteromonas sp. T1lg10]|uniref:beta strand repeat-containing protein n=1 Tax=Pseudoalteromonas sp. T1lg10 TaxID=2077093 RepID=UPI0018F8A96B
VTGQDLSSLADGELTVTMTVTDVAGNTGTVTDTTTLDTTAPNAPTVEAGNGTEITGTAEPGSEINVDVDGDGTADYTTTTDGDGNWRVTPDTPLADGTEVTATATDPAGNESAPASDIVDGSAPVVTLDALTTNDTTPALTGTIDDPEASIVVTVEGVDYTATNNGDGTWTLVDDTLPALMDGSYEVTVTATDGVGNSGTATGNLVIDTSAPTTGDGANSIAFNDGGDELVNANEATSMSFTGSVEAGATVNSITISDGVTTITVPSSAISTDSNGNLTVTGQDLSSLADGELTVTMAVTDAAGNTGTVTDTTTLDTAVDGNGNGQTVTFDSISNDSGTDGDFITSDTTLIFNGTIDLADNTTLTVSVAGTEYTFGTSPELTIDNNGNWSLDLSGAPLPAGTYPVIATVTDAAGNSLSTSSQDVVVQSLDAVNDGNAIDMGEPVVTVNPPQSTENVQVLGLAEATGGADASATFAVAPDNLGDVQIEVGQISLAAVADAYIVEVYDENGELVYQGVSANSQLADVGGLDIFNTTGDETIAISIPGLAAGNYSVVVRNDESKLQELLDGDGNGDISLTELGSAGVVLGPDNQAVVLDTVETTLNEAVLGIPLVNVGTIVRGVLEGLLETTTTIGAGELVNLLTGPLDALGLTSVLDEILGVVADALLSNTLTLLQGTDITTTVTEYSFTGETVAQGNLIEGDIVGAGADTSIDGAQVTAVTNAAGESVNVPATGTVIIEGAYGVLEIAADGSYTYTANGDPSSTGQNEVFNYTLSDGETSDSALLTITIAGGDLPPVQAQTDNIDMDLGAQTSVVSTPVTDCDMQVLGLLEGAPTAGSPIAGTQLTVGQGYFGEVVVEVSQNALVAVADAYIVEIVDANGNVVATAMSADNPLVGDVAGLNLLGVTGDDTLVAKFSGLPAGDYIVVVRNDESVLESLFDADGSGAISLTELGQGGVVLGEENQDVVLTAVENALNGSNSGILGSLGLGTVVRELILEPVLGAVDALGVGDLVATLTNGLNALGLTSLLDTVLDAVAEALLSNTLTLLQRTDVTSTLTEYAFEGSTSTSGNVIQGAANGDGSDSIAQGGVVTQVTHANGETVTVLGSGTEGVTIKGDFGDLTIFEDGSYTYVANGVRDGLGDSDSFSYTISDGTSSSTANLNFNLSGQGVSGDTARAEISYDFASEAGMSVTDALEYTWILGLLGATIPVITNTESDTITVAANTTQDLTLTVDGGDLLSLGSGLDIAVEKFVDGVWQVVETFSSDQLIGLLGLGGNGEFTVYGLTEGDYRVSMDVDTGVVSLIGGVSVDLSSTIHHLDQFVVDGVQTTSGSLLENDVLFDPAYSLTVSTDGTTFQDPTGGITLAGQYGTLQIDENGNYTYTPDSALEVFGSTLTDTFSYQVEYPDGTIEEAQFNVFITASGEGVPAATTLNAELLLSMVDGGELMLQPEVLASSEPRFNDKSEELMRQAVLEHTVEEDI